MDISALALASLLVVGELWLAFVLGAGIRRAIQLRMNLSPENIVSEGTSSFDESPGPIQILIIDLRRVGKTDLAGKVEDMLTMGVYTTGSDFLYDLVKILSSAVGALENADLPSDVVNQINDIFQRADCQLGDWRRSVEMDDLQWAKEMTMRLESKRQSKRTTCARLDLVGLGLSRPTPISPR